MQHQFSHQLFQRLQLNYLGSKVRDRISVCS
nr:MAG TPA: hypothetical protein [Crassvirales sp.]